MLPPALHSRGIDEAAGEEQNMRFALIGAGRIGKIHGGNIAAHADAELAYIADPDGAAAAHLAAATGSRVTALDQALTAADVEAVVICAPTDLHADLIERAAAAGKAIFCEKPVDLDAGRIVTCLGKVKAAAVPLMIGFNRRFDPNFAALQRRLQAGEAGEVELVSIISRDPGPPPIGYVARSGGLFRDMMIHDFDMARFLLGEEPVSVQAVGSVLVDPAIGTVGDIDTAAVLLTTASGRIVQISNSRRATYGYDQRIEVHGSKGMIRAGNVHNSTIELANASGFTADPVQNFFLERYANAYRLELDAFIAAVKAGRAPRPSGEDGLQAQILADAATRSWKTQQRVDL
jgi:myo-inositol 2-dehydrogenase/D-chiro-inositol 1-dehydrogenase